MSWFNLIVSQKPVWDSQELVTNTLTGSIVGELLVNKLLKNTSIYNKARNKASTFFASRLSAPLIPVSHDIALKILERTVEQHSFKKIFPQLFNRSDTLSRINHVSLKISFPNKNVPSKVKRSSASKSSVQQLIHLVLDNYVIKDNEMLEKSLKASFQSQKAFEQCIQKAIIKSLYPLCEKAVHTTLIALVRAQSSYTLDAVVRKTISVAATIFLYQWFAWHFTHDLFSVEDAEISSVAAFAQNLPPILFGLSTAYHAFQMGKIYWKTTKLNPEKNDLDKDKVKFLACTIAKGPITKALREAHLFKLLHIDLENDKINVLVKLLIDEIVDHYWKDLHQIQILGLPLVT